jgi:hypothetical protein
MPTILSFCGLPIPKEVRDNLAPAHTGEPTSVGTQYNLEIVR